MQEAKNPFSWEELSTFAANQSDIVNGPNNPYSLSRLFGEDPKATRVTLFRDNHAWCPYCQKVWLWLEFKKIPYKINKVTMRCYGNKEDWYLKKVSSGMLPAIELDKRLITESDQILLALEATFGHLGSPLEKSLVLSLRNLERQIFKAWCIWLCNPSFNQEQESKRKDQFKFAAKELDEHLSRTNSAWIDPCLSSIGKLSAGSIDVIFIPYLERMNASLAYYKGFNLREEFQNIDQWFNAFEALEVYRGSQGDFHTHAHDLPPQMGGCWRNKTITQKEFAKHIDNGVGLGDQETSFIESKEGKSASIALSRVVKHHKNIINISPLKEGLFDQPLRAALTTMITGKSCSPNKGSAVGLRYLRDRISVPRDMPLLAARELRKALEKTAQLDGNTQGPPIPFRNRFDQSPIPFMNISS